MVKVAVIAGMLGFAFAQEAATTGETEVVGASQSCMHCRKMDKEAGFLQSYSYCVQTDECLEDAWNYINRDCQDGWKRGDSYELDFCNAEEIVCPSYQSTPEKFGQYDNDTWSIAAGGQCVITLDATQGVARVYFFDDQGNLGIDFENYWVEQVITIESGQAEIPIYNAAETGPLTFAYSFSGAARLTQSATVAAAALYNLF